MERFNLNIRLAQDYFKQRKNAENAACDSSLSHAVLDDALYMPEVEVK